MSSHITKAERLIQIEQMLLAKPQGLNASEIAKRIGVHRSTIYRYMNSIPYVYLDDLDGSRWKIDRNGYLFNVRFTLHEAMAIHLATRLLATRIERQNPHAASALRKLSSALEKLAPRISIHLKQSADRIDDPSSHQDPNFLRTLEILTQAWAEEKKTRIWHRKEDGQVNEYLLSPYFIEPYAIGQAVHVIGFREPPGAIRTLKVERIERIELLSDSYRIPVDFDPESLLQFAWGIWYTEEEPAEVVLKFSPRVAYRVRETRWHRTEQLEAQTDGSLIWHARIAEPQEMLPWIRGWGADCEVLKPESLRKTLEEEVKKLVRIYPVSKE